jgi:hypothetical protein
LLRRASDLNLLPPQAKTPFDGILNASPSPYENEGFEDDEDLGGHDDAGSDFDPLREDVSSEGSCRTSIYNRSQAGDNEDSAN